LKKVLNLTTTDEDLLNRITYLKGRAKGLIFLENLVISSHKEIIKKTKEEINTNEVYFL